MRSDVIFAAIQLNSQAEVGQNLDRVATLVAEASRRGARAVLLPENFAYVGDEEGKRSFAEELPLGAAPTGQIGARLAELARAHGLHILAGGMPERAADPDRPYNTFAVFGPDGRLVARYRKIHLFDVDLPDGSRYRESAATTAGDEPLVVDIDGVRVGLSICYDLRFPELYRLQALAGAQILLVPAAFTRHTGRAHWELLLRARAVENQCFVIAAGQVGESLPGKECFGHSMVVDPWGTVLACRPEGTGIVLAELDFDAQRRIRSELPALANRRGDVYALQGPVHGHLR
jgi:predicted amidohydrolase